MSDLETRVPQIGQRATCSWRDSTKHKGEIVERRLKGSSAGGAPPSGSSAPSGSGSPKPDKPSDYEYYVHYVGFDRRLDEWIGSDRIDLTSIEVVQKRASPNDQGRTRGRGRPPSVNPPGAAHGHGSSNDPAILKLEKEHEELTKVKNIGAIQMGQYEIDTWYYSPYPDEYSGIPKLYVCEFCLKYMKSINTLRKHNSTCTCTRPPGDEIYRDGNVSVFEIDGNKDPLYCQSLCLLAKLFLDHKTLYYDVAPFMFYVVTETTQKGATVVGYFSKEKNSSEGYNLACILTFPQYQRSGYGKFIISLSYEISKREGKAGSPEKPLSDLGKLSYRSYWTLILFRLFRDRGDIDVEEICRETAIKVEDIISTLQHKDMVKEWKGQHVIHVEKSKVEEYLKRTERSKIRLCKPECLVWQPKEGTK
ncbi:hypothetical protein TrST_g13333 [Triparma strigata]|uniref:Histone acetyltransferase n=1 Tax=Triparma strigata TaxID=1606541 RepID=A0A9W7BJ93_9STRA|nr:hypothetical protein TrST_g13333 [Triparma strigata]